MILNPIVAMQDLEKIWYDPAHPAGFGGPSKLSKASGQPLKQVKKWLQSQLAYTLNKPTRRKFNTRPYRVGGINDLWQMDLMEMIPYAKINKGYKYILTCVDVFTRFARAAPLKNKTGKETASAISKLIKDEKPRNVQTDLGKEFYNPQVKQVFKQNKINHYSVNSQFKAALVERFNRTLREKMNKLFTAKGNKRWVDELPSLLKSYNNTKHRVLGMSPIEVNKENEEKIWYDQNKSLKKDKVKYKIGDYVRVSKVKGPFLKNFDNNWSDEVFIIEATDNKKPTMYSLKDEYGEKISGKFYEKELQVINKPDVYRIQEILKSKGKGKDKQYYVKWHGYKEPTWIQANQII